MTEILRKPSVLRPMTPADLAVLLPIQREAAQAAFATVFPQDEFPPVPHRVHSAQMGAGLGRSRHRVFVIVDADRSMRGFAAVRGDQFLHFGTALGS